MADADAFDDEFPMVREIIAMDYPHYHHFVSDIMNSYFLRLLDTRQFVELEMHRVSEETTLVAVNSPVEARRVSMVDLLERFHVYIHGDDSSGRPNFIQKMVRRCYCYYFVFPLYVISRWRDYLGLLPYCATLLSRAVSLWLWRNIQLARQRLLLEYVAVKVWHIPPGEGGRIVKRTAEMLDIKSMGDWLLGSCLEIFKSWVKVV